MLELVRPPRNIENMVLTGGRSAAKLYRHWASDSNVRSTLRNVEFFLGDERCVPPEDPSSNYRLVNECLFSAGVPDGSIFHRMEAEREDLALAAEHYAQILPKKIDLLLLSVGEDGHIASLFPGDKALRETQRLIIPVVAPKPPARRLTITPPVLDRAQQIYVLASGLTKRAIYEAALKDPADIDAIPARLVLDRTWIFDIF